MQETETKLAAARTRLILDKPFLGALVMRLPLVEADPSWCQTTATDARILYFNEQYIATLTVPETQFALAHEALHCALSHFARRLHRDKNRWDIACDLAINPLLIAEGLIPCPGALQLPQYNGMTAEEIYPCIDEQEQMNSHDHHIYDKENQSEGGAPPQNRPAEPQEPSKVDKQPDGGAEQPAPLTEQEKETLSVQWAQRLAGAHQQAMQAGLLGGDLARMIEHLLQPQLPWRMLLARYMTATARADYNWSRPNRREGEAILPSLRSNEIKIAVAIDTSGSISDQEMQAFVSEVDAIKGQVNARITLIACDAALSPEGPWHYEPWEAFNLPKQLTGGGGSDFRPVFNWLLNTDSSIDLLVYFTDAQGIFPEYEPSTPVIWLIKGQTSTPWGTRIQLN